MTNVFIDIETIPDMREGARDAFIEAALSEIKAPTSHTKDRLAADLGIICKDTVKSMSRDDLAEEWCRQVGATHAEEQGDAAWRKTSIDATQGQILMVGVAIDDDDPVVFHGPEDELLADFRSYLDWAFEDGNRGAMEFVGHNLVDFDLPFIFQRSVILGVQPHRAFPTSFSRYSDRLYDTMTKWAGFNNRIKLELLAKALGVGTKGDIDGSQVYDYYAEGRLPELIEYCKNDVWLTREVWRRMNFIKEVA